MSPYFGSVILLAGGQSRRMGFDKQQLTIGDERLTHRHIRQLGDIFDQIIVSTKTPELYTNLPVQTVADDYPDAGPLAGIHAGLNLARSRYVYVIACDMPEINGAYIELLKRTLSEHVGEGPNGIATVLNNNIEPFQAFFAQSLAPKIEISLKLGCHSARQFIRDHQFLLLNERQIQDAAIPLGIFKNLNKPEDIDWLSESEAIKEQVADVNENIETVRTIDVMRLTTKDSYVYTDSVIDEIRLMLSVHFENRDKKQELAPEIDARSLRTKEEPAEKMASIKGKESLYFHLLKDRIDDFVSGWLRTNRLIENKQDIVAISHRQTEDPTAWKADVTVTDKRGLLNLAEPTRDHRPSLTDIAHSLPFSPAWLFEKFDQLDRSAKRFHLTGGTHVLALYDQKLECLDVVEDVSRHVAFDKVIGKATKDNVLLADCFMLTSCRLTASIVEKAAAVGLTLLASRAAVTTRALKTAQKFNIRLIGFVRDGRMNIYP